MKKKSKLESELLALESQLLDIGRAMGDNTEVRLAIKKNKIKLLGAKKK